MFQIIAVIEQNIVYFFKSVSKQNSPERYPESNKQHLNSFQKTTRVLFGVINCTIQSKQIQNVYASKIIAQRGFASRKS